jgi:anti-sigma-K factor RskA
MSSTRLHDRIEELVATDALDGLDDAGRLELAREMASHGPDCAECALLVAEYAEAAASLALALEPVALSPGAEDRLMTAAHGSAAALEPAPGRAGILRFQRWAAVAALAAVLAVVAGVIGYGLAPKPEPIRSVALQGGPGQRLSVVYTPGDTAAVVVGSNLQAPPGGKVYELWYQPSAGAKMRPAGTFVPSRGSVLATVRVGSEFDLLAVSVEPDGGSPQPTSPPVFVAKV